MDPLLILLELVLSLFAAPALPPVRPADCVAGARQVGQAAVCPAVPGSAVPPSGDIGRAAGPADEGKSLPVGIDAGSAEPVDRPADRAASGG